MDVAPIETPRLQLVPNTRDEALAQIENMDPQASSGQVRIVRAHTIAGKSTSTLVLAKCGFRSVGRVVDPEDGVVWRWETLQRDRQ